MICCRICELLRAAWSGMPESEKLILALAEVDTFLLWIQVSTVHLTTF
jgi:hypothetical protein